jgi:hypothetical protein
MDRPFCAMGFEPGFSMAARDPPGWGSEPESVVQAEGAGVDPGHTKHKRLAVVKRIPANES